MQITGNLCCTIAPRALAAHLGCSFTTAEKTPCGCNVPTLIVGDFQVKHIAGALKYLARKYTKRATLCGTNPEDEALIDQFIATSARLQYLCSGLVATVYCPANIPGYNAKAHARALEMVKQNLTCVNNYLLTRTFLVSERPTIADFAMFGSLIPVFSTLFTKEEVTKFVNLIRWLNTICALDGVSSVVPKLTHSDHSIPKCPEEAKNVKPSFCHTKEEPQQATDSDGPKKRSEDRYAGLTFDMYAWKKHYKNLDWENNESWEPYFFEHYNPKEYSLWKCTYYDPSILGDDWKVKNLVTIWFQRLRAEKFDRHSFGNVNITINDSGSCNIIGVFMFPLDEVPCELINCGGSSSYLFDKLDLSNSDDKKLVIDVWNGVENHEIVHGGVNYGRIVDGEVWH